MAPEIPVTVTDEDGEETIHVLPARYEVCSKCEGYGTHLNEAIGSHAYTPEEFEREFDDEGRAEYFRRGGIYDVRCSACEGKRVLAVVNRDACHSPEQLEGLKAFDAQRREEAFYRQLVESERRFGC